MKIVNELIEKYLKGHSEDFIIEDYFHNSLKIKLLHQKEEDHLILSKS